MQKMKYTKSGVTLGVGKETQLPFLKTWTARIFATGFGTGYIPKGQGSLASAVALVLWIILVPKSLKAEILTAVGINLLSLPLAKWGEKMWGHDPGRVTIDEFAGQSIALIGLPSRSIFWLLLAFFLFRFFDVFKPKFVRKYIETLPGGWGITLDDTVAGLLARMVIEILRWFYSLGSRDAKS